MKEIIEAKDDLQQEEEITTDGANRTSLQSSLGSEEHKQMARKRNEVESIPSLFRRTYSIDLHWNHKL